MENDWKQKLKELGKLKDNWDSYEALPISKNALIESARIIELTTSHDIPVPEIIPTCDGNVSLEWFSPEFELEVQVTGKYPCSCVLEIGGHIVGSDIESDKDLLQILLN